uniref:AlNc14C393G11300 protein n=1 Tax=Albugo laibachii Nc14 TaxID=890382 RepID=F0WYN7_9STRA|nr:AlNc14C393G11300 [Albugo laibachii Nc14]|eukprot:CCA26596.1 AlNc14C393G11300 [Albugo laibachii Nc14]
MNENICAEKLAILWSIDARSLLVHFLSLGTHYSVKFHAPFIPNDPSNKSNFLNVFGFELSSVMNSNLIQVKRTQVVAKAESFLTVKGHDSAIKDEKSPSKSTAMSISEHDFCIGIDSHDLIWFPLSRRSCEKQILKQIQRENKSVTLHFAHLDSSRAPSPFDATTITQSHGFIIDVLNQVFEAQQQLSDRYRAFTNKREVCRLLQKEKKMVYHIYVKTQKMRYALERDLQYQHATRFQTWYKHFMKSKDKVPELESPQTSNLVREMTQVKKLETPEFPEAKSPRTRAFDRTLSGLEPDWIYQYFLKIDLKWIPKPEEVVLNFLRALMTNLGQDVVNSTPTEQQTLHIFNISRDIVVALIRMHLDRRKTEGITDHTTLYKRFAQHARMIRSNLQISENKQLREDILSKVLPEARLCEMSSEELAPKALQEERQRLHELHVQHSMIKNPIGKTLVKTKHGYKEVDFGGTEEFSQELATVEEPPITPPTPKSPPSTTMQKETLKDKDPSWGLTLAAGDTNGLDPSRTIANESSVILDKSMKSLKLDTSAPSPVANTKPKPRTGPKRVSFSEVVTQTLRFHPHDAPNLLEKHIPEASRASTPSGASSDISVVNARVFVRILFDGSYDFHARLNEFKTIVMSGMLHRIGQEFDMMEKIKLYRECHFNRPERKYDVRLRLAHLYGEADHMTELQAHLLAATAIEKSLMTFKRLLHDVVHDLKGMFPALTQSADQSPERIKSQLDAFQHLTSRKIAKVSVLPVHGSEPFSRHRFQGRVAVDSLVLAYACRETIAETRNAAIVEAMDLFVGILKAVELKAQAQDQAQAPVSSVKPSIDTRTNWRKESVMRANEKQDDPMGSPIKSEPSPRERFQHRKRSLESQQDYVEPLPYRRRLECHKQSNEEHRVPIERKKPAPAFFVVDKIGQDEKRVIPASFTADEKLGMLTNGYKELVKQYFKDRNEFHTLLEAIRADPQEEVKEFTFTKNLKVTRKLTKYGDASFLCTAEALDQKIFAEKKAKTSEEAIRLAILELKMQGDRIGHDWKKQIETYRYASVKASSSIMAANETRAKHNRWIHGAESRAGHLYSYKIFVSDFLMIRASCPNAKEAKRAASEQYRDFLESIKTLEESKIAHVKREERLVPKRAAPVSQRSKPKVIVCSDDEDEDDEDDYDSNSGSDTEWLSAYKPSTANVVVKSEHKDAMEDISMTQTTPQDVYDVSSEAKPLECARFRALLRCLFSCKNKLFEIVDGLRGSLSFQGAAERVICPNVKACMRMERLQEGVIDVYISVNDTIQFVASHSSKRMACDLAIDGILEKLTQTHAVWAQLLHFFQLRVLSTANTMESINALVLANIARFDIRFEEPFPTAFSSRKCLTHVVCVLAIDAHIIARIDADDENAGRYAVLSEAEKFFINLVDVAMSSKSMNPTKSEATDSTLLTGSRDMEADTNHRSDFSCVLRLRDSGNLDSYQEFRLYGTWCLEHKAPFIKEFLKVDCEKGLLLTQMEQIRMGEFEQLAKNGSGSISCFVLESAFEHSKFVNALAEYGNKNKYKAHALKCTIDPVKHYRALILPAGGSINSLQPNLYWPAHRPKSVTDWRKVYGMLQLQSDTGKIL